MKHLCNLAFWVFFIAVVVGPAKLGTYAGEMVHSFQQAAEGK